MLSKLELFLYSDLEFKNSLKGSHTIWHIRNCSSNWKHIFEARDIFSTVSNYFLFIICYQKFVKLRVYHTSRNNIIFGGSYSNYWVKPPAHPNPTYHWGHTTGLSSLFMLASWSHGCGIIQLSSGRAQLGGVGHWLHQGTNNRVDSMSLMPSLEPVTEMNLRRAGFVIWYQTWQIWRMSGISTFIWLMSTWESSCKGMVYSVEATE